MTYIPRVRIGIRGWGFRTTIFGFRPRVVQIGTSGIIALGCYEDCMCATVDGNDKPFRVSLANNFHSFHN